MLLGRMIPIFRGLISVPAGVERMPLPVFLLFIGSLVGNTTFILAGYFLGANWSSVEASASVFQRLVVILCVVAVAAFVAVRLARRHHVR